MNIRWQANMIASRVSVLPKLDVDSDRVGRKMYGFKAYLRVDCG